MGPKGGATIMGRSGAGADHYAWKGDGALPTTKRQRAVRLYRLGLCERCGRRGVDRHHKDGNTGNNDRSNIEILCRKCHMIVDGRLAAWLANNPAPAKFKPASPCRICGRLAKPLRKGKCSACDMYFRRHGVEWTPTVVSTRRRIPGILDQSGSRRQDDCT
jgi:hypothetical protein